VLRSNEVTPIRLKENIWLEHPDNTDRINTLDRVAPRWFERKTLAASRTPCHLLVADVLPNDATESDAIESEYRMRQIRLGRIDHGT
jgi:hypothetical protein